MNENTESNITIVTVCDNNYIMLLATLLKSIESNTLDKRQIDFYVVEDKISNKNKIKFENSFKTAFIKIHWLKTIDVIPKEFKLPTDSSTYPLNIYARLFIPYFIPKAIKRVIYLDVDMVVLKDILELWDTDLEGKAVGAVQDVFGTAHHGIKNYKELGISKDSKYFNSGLLLIDTMSWRENNITEKLIECLKLNKEYAKYPDQYGLNVVLSEKWFQLDSRWNTFTYQDVENPFLIHYIGYKPIYKDYTGKREYLDQFYYYLNLTNWKGYSPRSKYFRYATKFKTKVKKFLYESNLRTTSF